VKELAATVLRRAAAGRLRGTITDPATGAARVVTPTRGWIAEVIRHELYSARSAAGLPAALHEAATGDATTLIARGIRRRRVLDGQIALGVLLTATCSEDVRAIDPGGIGAATAGTLLGDARVRDQLRACAAWPAAALPIGFGAIPPSRVPVLLISGASDPATGPSWATGVAARLRNAQHLVVPFAGHGLDGLRNAQCVGAMQAEFIRRAAPVTDLVRCLGSIQRMPFEIPPLS
jgi:pimeloyl-ACP methyl ester carboxylesterase